MTEHKSFLGLLNYYTKFLPSLPTTLAPLYKLLQAKVRWTWGTTQKKAFEVAKAALTSDHLLIHCDPDRPLLLACDASSYGVSAVLSHQLPDGLDHPIAYVS